MKVTMVTSTFLPTIGGAEIVIFHLSNALIKLGVDVEIIAPFSRKNISRMAAETAIYNETLRVRLIPLSPKLSFSSLTFGLLKFAFNSDIVHAHFLYPSGFASALYKALTSKPYVVTMHGSDILVEKSIGYGMRLDPKIDLLTKFVIKNADALIAPSKVVAEKAFKAGASTSKVRIIPNGVDTEKFNPNMESNIVRNKLNLNSAEHVVLTVANFRPVKGYKYLVEAIPLILKRCPNTIFVFVGDGPEKIKVIYRVNELGVANKTIFAGLVPYEMMPLYYAAADVFVLSSISESFSLTTLEAMASGKPIIAPPVGALSELLLNGDCGALIDIKNPISLAESVIKFLKNESLKKKAGERARKIVEEKYSWDAIAKKHLALYNDVIG